MKVSNLRRKKNIATMKSIQTAVEVNPSVDISSQVAKARSSIVSSRGEFAARAAKARKSFPKSANTVMLG